MTRTTSQPPRWRDAPRRGLRSAALRVRNRWSSSAALRVRNRWSSSAALRVPPPERRRRGDLVAIAVIAVVAVVGVWVVLGSGDGAGTTDQRAGTPLAAPAEGPVPTALTEAWRAESPATPTPVVAGPAVVTAGGSDGGGRVVGHDAVTGADAWSYTRPEPVCTAGAAFGEALAIFRTEGPLGVWCSDVASLDPATGARGPSRNADVRDGTRLLADRDHVTATGRDVIETWRSDLVLTTQVGNVPTPVQPPDAQPRAGCVNGSIAVGGGTVGMMQRCPGEPSDRLTVVRADPRSSEKPEERFSTLTGVTGARLVALTSTLAAWTAPDGLLRTTGATGEVQAVYPLGSAAGPTTDPAGLAAVVRPVGPALLWWTGTATVGLDPDDLRPRWALPGTLGTGAAWPGADPATALVPVARGLVVVDAATGVARATIGVDRGPAAGNPVAMATIGTTVLEQRGPVVVALRPTR